MLTLRERLISVSVAVPVPLAWRYVAGIVALSAATVAAAYIRIPLPFSPVPITLQTGVVLIAGATLGAAGGGVSQMLYLAVGLLGAPVFAASSGLSGPTVGYLISFVPAAMVVGWAARGGWQLPRLAGGMLAATALIYVCGVVGLVLTTGIDWSAAVTTGVLPFLPGDLLKLVGALGVSRVTTPAWSHWCRGQ